MHDVEKEIRAAQHLLYVSLKYTKTCDVILNLLYRWENIMALSMELILANLKKKKSIKEIPIAPKMKIDVLSKVFKKNEEMMNTLILYSFLRKINQCHQSREHEFRKNVALVVTDAVTGKETRIDMEKLKQWEEILEKFIYFVRHFL